MKKSIYFILILMTFIFSAFGCSQNKELYNITFEETQNGKITTNVEKAKKGEMISVVVTPNLGYEIEEGSLKYNDVVINNNSFKMPRENVTITCNFILISNEITISNSGFDFSVVNNENIATAHIFTYFTETEIVFKIVVEDNQIYAKDSFGRGDGILLLFGHKTNSWGYLNGKTAKIEANANGNSKFFIFNGESFIDNSNCNSSISIFTKNNKVAGYVVDFSVKYSTINFNKNDTKGNLSICPVLYNLDSNLSSTTIKFGSHEEFGCKLREANTHVIVENDNEYVSRKKTSGIGHFSFLNNQYNNNWDLSSDYAPDHANYANRKSILSGSDGQDNILYFFRENGNAIYVEATFLLTDVFINPNTGMKEDYGKYGIRFVDKNGHGLFFFMDCYGTSLGGMVGTRNGGYVLRTNIGDTYNWETHEIIHSNYRPQNQERVKLGICRTGNKFLLFLNDTYVAEIKDIYGIDENEEIYPSIASFNLGIEVTNYFVTTEIRSILEKVPSEAPNGYIFKSVVDFYKNGIFWDLSRDTELNPGSVDLIGHDYKDNHLFFGITSNTFMYAKTTITLVDYINKGDAWLKFGLCLFDYKNQNETVQNFYYVDAYTGNEDLASHIDHIIGDGFGKINIINGNYSGWTEIPSSFRFNLSNFTITMEMIYADGKIYFIVDGNLIISESYVPISTNLFIGIKNFGFGMKLTDYYCTIDRNDPKIKGSLNSIGL